MKGSANIPLILSLLLLVVAVPVGVRLVQENQNTQNRAYEVTTNLSCVQFNSARLQYCSGTNISPVTSGVPCDLVNQAYVTYCQTDIYPTPTNRPRPTLTGIPIPTSTPIPQSRCLEGQTKCSGRMLLQCIKGTWLFQKTCVSCVNGKCLTTKPPIQVPPPQPTLSIY